TKQHEVGNLAALELDATANGIVDDDRLSVGYAEAQRVRLGGGALAGDAGVDRGAVTAVAALERIIGGIGSTEAWVCPVTLVQTRGVALVACPAFRLAVRAEGAMAGPFVPVEAEPEQVLAD